MPNLENDMEITLDGGTDHVVVRTQLTSTVAHMKEVWSDYINQGRDMIDVRPKRQFLKASLKTNYVTITRLRTSSTD